MERLTPETETETQYHGSKKLSIAILAVAATTLSAIQPAKAEDGAGTPGENSDCNCEVEYDAGYKEGDADGFIAGHKAGHEAGREAGYNEAEDRCKKRCEGTKVGKKPRKKPITKPTAPTSFTERNPKMPRNISFPCVLRTDYGEKSGYKLTMALPDDSVEREGNIKIGDINTVGITLLHDSGNITVDLKNEHKANGDDALTYEMTIDPSDKLERTTTCQFERSLPPKTSTGGDNCPRQIQLDIGTQVVGGFLDGTIKEGPDEIQKPKDMTCATYHLPNPNPIPGVPPESDLYCWTTDTCAYGTALKQPLPPEDPKKPRKPEETRANLRHTLLPY